MQTNKAWTEEEQQRLLQMIAANASPARLSAHFGRSALAVRSMARKLEVTVTPLKERKRQLQAKLSAGAAGESGDAR
jgi:hypothetical protein